MKQTITKSLFASTTISVSGFSKNALAPGKFQTFQVVDDWLSQGSSKTAQTRGIQTSIKLPNADKAVVERDKILSYLLNPEHRIGASKAKFFTNFGFSAEKWELLAKALLIHGQTHEVKRVHETDFGPRYEIEGSLHTPDGREPNIRSVWQWDKGTVAPRLITAYPLTAR